jgi:hypothetical protein
MSGLLAWFVIDSEVMSAFNEHREVIWLQESQKWVTTKPMSFYLLWPTGPAVVVPTGFKAEYSDNRARWTRRFSGLTDQQLGKGALLHDYVLHMDARRSVASAVLYEALRAQGGRWLYCLGAFLGSWIITSRKGRDDA